MAELDEDFDADQVEPSTGFDPIPAGEYEAVMTESEWKPTKDGQGQFLQLTFEIIAGEFKGRKLWSRLNLRNRSDKAVQIARGELSAICRAVSVPKPKDTAELHNLPLTVKVKCRKREDNGELTNEIDRYMPKGGSKQQQQKASGGTTPTNGKPPAAGAAAGDAPWKKRA